MVTLKGWKEYCQLRSRGVKLCDDEKSLDLNRFRARFKAAKRFRAVILEGYSDETTRGYSAGIRLLMCYTAAELLGKTISDDVNNWIIQDTSIESALRTTCGNVHENKNVINQGKLRANLKDFTEGNCDNLRVVATALRVMVAHGHFTPFGTKSTTKKNSDAIYRLSDHLLANSETRFKNWLDRQIENLS